MNLIKILLATNGSQGVNTLSKLYALGYDNDDLSVLTFESKFNQTFIEFLKFNQKEYTIIESCEHLEKFFKNQPFDILISLSFRFIFSERVLNNIKLAAINFHPGILPDYRGSFSIPWAIINNEEYVGYTYHHMIQKVDRGQIVIKEKIPILNRTAHTLNYLVFQSGIAKLGLVLEKIEKGEKVKVKSDVEGKFYSNKLPFNGEIDTNWVEQKIERFIRAMYFPPFDPAYIKIGKTKHFFKSFSDYKSFIKK